MCSWVGVPVSVYILTAVLCRSQCYLPEKKKEEGKKKEVEKEKAGKKKPGRIRTLGPGAADQIERLAPGRFTTDFNATRPVQLRKWSRERKWSPTANDPKIGPQMIPAPQMIPWVDRKWSRKKLRNGVDGGPHIFSLLNIFPGKNWNRAR